VIAQALEMIVLPVKIGRPLKGYSSIEAAIAAAKQHPRQHKARADGALLVGQSFVGGRAGFSRWSLEFTGSLWVDITSRDDEVDWRVTHKPPIFGHVTEPYALRWPSGQDELIDPAKLFASRVDARFWQLWVNEVGFYVYLNHKLILCFHSVRRAEDGTCVLAVYEDD
jgi:hypothetical protein